MTPEQIRQEIFGVVVSTWATADTIAWPNRPFNPDPNKNWIRPTILMADSDYGELGGDGVGIRTGVLIVQIFVPAGTGIKNANTHASSFETAFRRQDLDGVIFDEVSTREIGIDKGGEQNFYQVNVHAPFRAFIGE